MNNIFNTSLKLDFSPYAQDLAKRGRSRLLGQFASQFPQQAQIDEYKAEKQSYYVQQGYSENEAAELAGEDVAKAVREIADGYFCPVLAQAMNAVGSEFSALYNAMLAMVEGRTLAVAKGVNLDVLGMIVGQTRTLFDYSLKDWFTPDNTPPLSPDSGLAWTLNANLYGDGRADDNVYRQMILAKIFKNHVRGASAPETRSCLRMAGQLVSFQKDGVLGVAVVVSIGSNTAFIRNFCKKLKTKYIDSTYLMPIPPCVEITGVIVMPTKNNMGAGFTPDRPGLGADIGLAAVKTTL